MMMHLDEWNEPPEGSGWDRDEQRGLAAALARLFLTESTLSDGCGLDVPTSPSLQTLSDGGGLDVPTSPSLQTLSDGGALDVVRGLHLTNKSPPTIQTPTLAGPECGLGRFRWSRELELAESTHPGGFLRGRGERCCALGSLQATLSVHLQECAMSPK
jgi:hypothetical protein